MSFKVLHWSRARDRLTGKEDQRFPLSCMSLSYPEDWKDVSAYAAIVCANEKGRNWCGSPSSAPVPCSFVFFFRSHMLFSAVLQEVSSSPSIQFPCSFLILIVRISPYQYDSGDYEQDAQQYHKEQHVCESGASVIFVRTYTWLRNCSRAGVHNDDEE